jgi:uncharacterized membrane protein YhaH (DUF805 family)
MIGQKRVKWCFEPLIKYADFSGRARRSEYWWFVLFNMTVTTVLGFIEGMIGFAAESHYSVFAGIYCLAVLLPSIAVTIRRLHDTGHNGWWFWISLIPILGSIVLLVYLVTDSGPGRNQYGPNPKVVSTALTAQARVPVS